MNSIRIYDMPAGRMVSSGAGMFGQEKFERFAAWFSAQPRTMCPQDFHYWDAQAQAFCWLYAYSEGMRVPVEFEIIDFPGGLYAVATDIDQRTDMEAMRREKDAFLLAHGLERDDSRVELGNIITSPRAYKVLGFEQMDYYTPVKERA